MSLINNKGTISMDNNNNVSIGNEYHRTNITVDPSDPTSPFTTAISSNPTEIDNIIYDSFNMLLDNIKKHPESVSKVLAISQEYISDDTDYGMTKLKSFKNKLYAIKNCAKSGINSSRLRTVGHAIAMKYSNYNHIRHAKNVIPLSIKVHELYLYYYRYTTEAQQLQNDPEDVSDYQKRSRSASNNNRNLSARNRSDSRSRSRGRGRSPSYYVKQEIELLHKEKELLKKEKELLNTRKQLCQECGDRNFGQFDEHNVFYCYKCWERYNAYE
eukprot:202507_1